MKLNEIGEIALREYKTVKYFPFKNDAGAPFTLTSDPLGYLEAYIDNWHNSIRRDKYKVKNRLVKARYFTQLSRDFYNSSLQAKMPSKGTLLYYSFINLVKVHLLINGYELETKVEHHGLSLPANSADKLKLTNPNGGGISIFHEFAKVLGKEIKPADGPYLNFLDLAWELPEVHEIGYALNLFNKKRKFLPIDISIRTNQNRNRIFYTISYEKKFDKQMKVDRLTKGICNAKLIELDIEDDTKRKYFKSKFSTANTKGSNRSWIMCYKKISKDLEALNITPMLTRQGYRYYLDLEPYRIHRLSSFLGFAYYIGTIARYRPTLNEKVLKGKFQPLINEAIISCPNQFFYLMTSHITKQICAIPMAKIE